MMDLSYYAGAYFWMTTLFIVVPLGFLIALLLNWLD
jgi:hypothetical protein